MSIRYLQAQLDKVPAASRPDVIELCINPDGSIWAEFQGDHFMRPLEQSLTEVEVSDLAKQISSAASATISKQKPILSVSVEFRGRPIRAQVIIPPAVAKGTSIALRFFSTLSLEDIELSFLHGKEHSLETERLERNLDLRKIVKGGDISAAIEFCVSNKLNMIVAGGTSTGKTVAARKILSFVGDDERIVTIEEAAELNPAQPNVVTLISNRDVEAQSADNLLTSTLRMRPDRIVLGEVRGKEAMTFLEAINTGHGGSLTTLHAETPQLAIQRLAIAALKTDVPMTYSDMLRYIENSIDVVIQAGRHNGKRGITEFYLPGQTGNSPGIVKEVAA